MLLRLVGARVDEAARSGLPADAREVLATDLEAVINPHMAAAAEVIAHSLEPLGASYCTRVLRLAFLSPEITTATLRGEQPADLTPRQLMNDTRLILDWREQKSALDFI